ncbi:MAG: hypothetical protein U9N56_07490 [Actinomycetota bacterium]|nr:hypothetical protein [Actinomycetota bacterium]
MNSSYAAAAPLLASLAWTIALIIEPDPYDSSAALLIGIGLLSMATVSVIGMVAAGGRWAHRLGIGTIAGTLLVAAVRPVDPAWVVGLAVTTASGLMIFLPGVTRGIRKLPAATGPPERAVLLSIALLVSPFAIGVSAADGTEWTHLLVGLSGLLASFAYSRVIPGGLLVARIVWPTIAIGLAIPMGLPSGVVSAALGITTAVLAWDPSVKTAFHPPRETGSSYPIPPELAPKEILDAAQIDDRGLDL